MKKLIVLLLLISNVGLAQNGRRLEILFLGDNSHHKPIERVPTLMVALGSKGINFTYTDDLSDINESYLQKFDALMVYANIDEITPQAEKALLDFVASGKGFLPIHCASYCFRNSEEYVKLVGGQFWRHGMDSVSTNTLQPNHHIMKGLSPFTAYDETYLHSQLGADNNVLAEREIKIDQANDKPGIKTEPYSWTRTHGKGKVFYTAYGHDDRTWSQKGFQDLIYNAILWSVNDEALASFNARNAEPFQYREAKLPNYERRPGTQYLQLALSPEESMKHIQVPNGFELELFAAEPNVMHPIAMTWDEKGRLFVLITKDYPNERKPEGGGDYILICEDTDKDGKADKFTKFAEGLSIPTGMVFANGGLVVTQAPDVLFFKDTDGDDKADIKKTLYSGFGTFDTHAGPSNLHYGFDNWIWGCVGYSGYEGKNKNGEAIKFGQAFFRFKADGSDLEWMTTTNNNTWGFAFNETNDVFGSTANNAHGWYMAIPHSYFNATNRVNNGSRNTDTHKDMKSITPKVRQVDVFGGFTAASGHNFYTARALPEKYWNKIAFVTEPTGHIVHQNNMVKNGTDFSDKEAFNLMAGADEWFSPVFAETGPDGAVWVADWYSFIIQHNPRPDGFEMGTGNAYDTDLRDFTHGRIYRVSYKEAKAYTPLSLSKDNPDGLIDALKNDNMFWRMQAQRLLVERENKDVVPALVKLLKSRDTDQIGLNPAAIHALWTLQGLGAITDKIISIGLAHPNADVRKNTLKVMPFTANSVKEIVSKKLLYDKEPLVVLNSLLVISKSPLDAHSEKAFFAKLNSSTDTQDRWLPDAFSIVLTANDGELMKKHLVNHAKVTSNISVPSVDHDHAAMMDKMVFKDEQVKGLDLIVSDIKMNPSSPSVQERVAVTVDIKNQGDQDLPIGVFVPFEIKYQGKSLFVKQTSRNFNEGIKAGETVSITRNINGPWKGDLAFSSDLGGEYNVSVELDKFKELSTEDGSNNSKSKKITISPPQNMNAFVLERAIRSQASVSSPAEIVQMIRDVQSFDANGRNSIYKAISQGNDYDLKNVALSDNDKSFINSLNDIDNVYLSKVLKAWNVLARDPNVRVITIRAIREAMKYDLTAFKVKAGETVELVFINPDAMPHNIVITKPGSMEKVGTASDKMMMDNKAAEKNYVPEMSEVLFSSPLVNADETYRLTFKVPSEKGEYPYICTFPGHWRLMRGVMTVE
jgi:putative membrane-bound dehydrogenase-like protein